MIMRTVASSKRKFIFKCSDVIEIRDGIKLSSTRDCCYYCLSNPSHGTHREVFR